MMFTHTRIRPTPETTTHGKTQTTRLLVGANCAKSMGLGAVCGWQPRPQADHERSTTKRQHGAKWQNLLGTCRPTRKPLHHLLHHAAGELVGCCWQAIRVHKTGACCSYLPHSKWEMCKLPLLKGSANITGIQVLNGCMHR